MLYNYSNPDSNFQRLLDLGMSSELVRRVVEVGAAEAATFTAAEPRGAGEWARWAFGVGELHRQLVPLGWTREDPNNQPTFISPSGKHSIILASGSAGTGELSFVTPTTRNPKGISFMSAVVANGQISLFDFGAPVELSPRETWILLIRALGNKVFAEVSLPISMSSAKIDQWLHRIILPPTEFEGFDFGNGPDDDGPDYTFEVTPK